jgi:hypothetical protein
MAIMEESVNSHNENYRMAQALSQASAGERLAALRKAMEAPGARPAEPSPFFVNNHIHSIYSFSPYSPAAAAYVAWRNGLATAGIMDHDSLAGAEEFLEACKAVGVAATVGFECRVKMNRTPFAGRRFNNPDQASIAYMACHGVPRQNISKAQEWLAPCRRHRRRRGMAMVDRLNERLAGTGVSLNFLYDVQGISQYANGGTITERHILFALASRISKTFDSGADRLRFLEDKLSIHVTGRAAAALADESDALYDFNMLGALKANLVKSFYIDADEECPDVFEFLDFAKSIGAIPAYPYLGDVENSVTGDKRDERFEDEYLGELTKWLAQAGFPAVTYMPARNSLAQLRRLMGLLEAEGLFQISGEDINAPTQPFICDKLAEPEFRGLVDSTWALIGHEKAAAADQEGGMFSQKSMAAMPGLAERVESFGKKGREGG